MEEQNLSWSITVPAVPVEEFGVACDDAPNDYESSVEGQAQIDAAKAAAKAIVASGAAGAGCWVRASLNGHANRGHQPQDGYSPDQISVTVQQMTAPVASEESQSQAEVPGA